eukprot:m.233771 g.233771  ORF g.233771 m.233771 type:complete len:112 (+) comp12566_c0_seq1:1267-1602(+)
MMDQTARHVWKSLVGSIEPCLFASAATGSHIVELDDPIFNLESPYHDICDLGKGEQITLSDGQMDSRALILETMRCNPGPYCRLRDTLADGEVVELPDGRRGQSVETAHKC